MLVCDQVRLDAFSLHYFSSFMLVCNGCSYYVRTIVIDFFEDAVHTFYSFFVPDRSEIASTKTSVNVIDVLIKNKKTCRWKEYECVAATNKMRDSQDR